MEPRLDDLVPALERFRDAVAQGEHDLGSARRRLAGFRIGLLRLRRRAIALVLSEGARNSHRLLDAIDAALASLHEEREARLRCVPALAAQR